LRHVRAILLAALSFIVAAILFWVAAMVLYSVGSKLGWWVDRDGGVAMGFAFTIGPLFGLVGGLIAALLAFFRFRRKSAGS
jgi:hypothetical protein